MDILKTITEEFKLREDHVQNIVQLLDEGNTIPFIARYRKEMTGHIDDQVLRDFADRLNYLRNIEKRKAEVTASITEQGKMTDEIMLALAGAETLTEAEDIYRPFKQKRKTRASVAIEKGLSPLADFILEQTKESLEEKAKEFINEEKGVLDIQGAILGAQDIIAEKISDDADIRKDLREFIFKSSFILTSLKPNDKVNTYLMYDNYKEQVCKMPSHRILAINRGEKEDCLKVVLEVNEEKCLELIKNNFKIEESIFTEKLNETVLDSFNRLILPSLEREIRNNMFDDASEQAIKMFEVNLKPLLLQPPLKHTKGGRAYVIRWFLYTHH